MRTVTTVAELRAALETARGKGRSVALVPTMGNLHSGHIALVKRARDEAGLVVASVFVNPLQFGANEDLDSYPRTLAADQEKLQSAGCDLLFAPTVEQMYPHGQQQLTRVSVPQVSEGLCGGSRPGHFTGVATVVCKLFNLVQPDVAVFGQKDFQQLAVIRRMVRDLDIPVRLIGEPTVRAANGLALSSRNGYLSAAERDLAPILYRVLTTLADQIRQGRRDHAALLAEGRASIEAAGLQVDYLELRDALSLETATAESRQLVLLVAAFIGRTRLIDNLQLDLDSLE
ncbi:pantoate--beta-alanine ligase [Stutzerimonas tarimensis]|uniref:Pantothenate synthetase n=1 Tax=Stutzerimonas tarimensis TaxID=1507735 RepID=A0ABV7SZC7_9GAMM